MILKLKGLNGTVDLETKSHQELQAINQGGCGHTVATRCWLRQGLIIVAGEPSSVFMGQPPHLSPSLPSVGLTLTWLALVAVSNLAQPLFSKMGEVNLRC